MKCTIFYDKAPLCLHPEGTAPVVRSYVENKLFAPEVQSRKFYHMGPMFRYERPHRAFAPVLTRLQVECFILAIQLPMWKPSLWQSFRKKLVSMCQIQFLNT